MNRNALYKWFFCFWTLAILVLLLLPPGFFSGNAEKIVRIPYSDKIVHFILFGVFCLAFYLYIKTRRIIDKKKLMLLCLSVTAAYGMAGELLQMLTNRWMHRTFSWTDFVADVAGALFALLFTLVAKNKSNR